MGVNCVSVSRQLMKELMIFREQVFRHLSQDWSDAVERAGNLWSPRWREAHMIRPTPPIPQRPNNNGRSASSSSSGSTDSTTNQSNTAATPHPATPAAAVATNVFPEEPEVLLVSETAMPELWLPGRLLHLHSYRGVFRASYVPRNFPTLRRIELQGNMFADHRSGCIFDGLLEVLYFWLFALFLLTCFVCCHFV